MWKQLILHNRLGLGDAGYKDVFDVILLVLYDFFNAV